MFHDPYQIKTMPPGYFHGLSHDILKDIPKFFGLKVPYIDQTPGIRR